MTPRVPFKRTVGPLDITLENFDTEPDNKNPYSFSGTTDAGETISWSGVFSLSPLRSSGELRLFRFTLKHSALLAFIIGLTVMFIAYVVPGWAP